MFDTLNLNQAAAELFNLTNNRHFHEAPAAILEAGAQGRISVFWSNSTQRYSSLCGFSGEIEGTKKAIRMLRVPLHDLARLQVSDEIQVSCFSPDDDDQVSLDAVGSNNGFRGLVDGGSVTVRREHLRVRHHNVVELATELIECQVQVENVSSESGIEVVYPPEPDSVSQDASKLLSSTKITIREKEVMSCSTPIIISVKSSKPASKPKNWRVAWAYIVDQQREGRYRTGKLLFSALQKGIGSPMSPFKKGEHEKRGSLIIIQNGSSLACKTILNHISQIRAEART
ncbi:MAG: hypothetical protein AB9M53_06980 [Leptothrix sp. (in: b-proteobacteria)]